MGELSIKQKKEWAQLLFFKENLTQKEIALKVGVSEKTIGNWKEAENWDDFRKALFISKEEQIRRSYLMIDNQLNEIEEKQVGIPTNAQADVLAKLAATIRSLETETNVAQVTDVFKEFINFLKPQDFSKAQDFIAYLDAFVKHKLKAS